MVDVKVDGTRVELVLWDTYGNVNREGVRPLAYADAHVVLVCFAIDEPSILEDV